jgi:hypothetical protein
MKKLLGTIAVLKGLRESKKATAYNTTWEEDTKDFVKMLRAAWRSCLEGRLQYQEANYTSYAFGPRLHTKPF